jgi:O-antigen/teichoic acid export membrane protein
MAIFGPEFRESAPLLWYICAAQLFSAACGPVGLLLMMTGHTGAALVGQAVSLAANLCLGLWLIPDHGATGAAIAMAFGIVCVNSILLVAARMSVGVDASLLAVLFRPGTSGRQG